MAGHIAAGLLLLLLGAPPSAAFSAGPPAAPLDLSGYTAELERCSATVAALEAHPEQSEAFRQSLAPSWTVVAGNQSFDLSTGWLDDALRRFASRPAERDAILRSVQARLIALHDDAVALAQQTLAVNTTAATERLDAILSRREFQATRYDSWWRKLQEAAFAWVGRLLDLIFGAIAQKPGTRRVLTWLLIVAGFALVVLLLRGIWMGAPAQQTFDPGGLPANPEGWLAWRARAQVAASRGDHAEAVRCAYWAVVLWLGESGVWKADMTRTPREYLTLLPGGHAGGPPLLALTRRFEDVWYRRQAGTRDDFQDAMVQVEAIGCPFVSSETIDKS